MLKEVNSLNERQKKLLQQKAEQFFGKDLTGRTFSVWGVSFKPKTSDIREAPALVLIKDLLDCGATIKVYDPIAMQEAKNIFRDHGAIHFSDSIAHSIVDSSGIFLVTEWDEFRAVNFTELGAQMKEKIVFDGRNIYEPELILEEGFRYFGVGRK